MGQYQTFIVRFWTDHSANTVRGHVQHIGSQRGIYFRDVTRLIEFVSEFLGPTGLPVMVAEDGRQLLEEPPPSITQAEESDESVNA